MLGSSRERMSRTILLAAVLAALVVGTAIAVAPAGGASSAQSREGATSVTARMLAAPRARAFVTGGRVRVVIRVPRGTTRLKVRLGRRDVTSRFRRARGSRRVARLTRRQGLRRGENQIFVRAERRGRRSLVQARTIYVVRRQAGLLRVRVRSGPVTSLRLRVAGRFRLRVGHFGQPGAVERRLPELRRRRIVRVRLNGRLVTGATARSQPTLWTGSLSASYGLRYGVNRLRVLVAEPGRGRYAVVSRRFVIRRTKHLAAAGRDRKVRPGWHVRLDARRSRAARGGRLRYRWRLIAKPRGSRARLRRPRAARPLVVPDRPGRYAVRLTVRRGSPRRTSSDRVTLQSAPNSLLVPFQGLSQQGGRNGIQIGGTFYPNTSPTGKGMQWLTLDRNTLLPVRNGNSWIDGSGGDGEHGVPELQAALTTQGLNQLVVLSHAPASLPAVDSNQYDAFNDAMKVLGVGSIDPILLGAKGEKLVIAGVPLGGGGSGSYTHGGAPNGLKGSLIPDVSERFRFVSERPEFNTSASSTSSKNTMMVREQSVSETLLPDTEGGFQVTIINPVDFTVQDSQVFRTYGVGDGNSANDLIGLRAMAKFLNDNADDRWHVAVQSIGHVQNPGVDFFGNEDPIQAWLDVATALSQYGANPHIFATANGSYAFLGGSQLDRDQSVDSSSQIVLDPTTDPPTREKGTLKGRATMRPDGAFKPVAVDPAESFDSKLYDIVFASPTPWKYTAAAGEPNADAYTKALADISNYVQDLKPYPPSPRVAYSKDAAVTAINWSDAKTDLLGMPYPGDGYTCTNDAGRIKKYPGYTRQQFCALSQELQTEFDWINAVKTLFSNYEEVFNRSGGAQWGDLQTIGTDILDKLPGQDPSTAVAWEVGGAVAALGSAGLVLGPSPPLVAWEAFVAVYELIEQLTTGGGAPVGGEIEKKINQLAAGVETRMFDAANALDRLRDVIVSDYGRLSTLGPVADGPNWAVDSGKMANNLRGGASAGFSSALVPIAYGVYYLYPSSFNEQPTTDNCFIAAHGFNFRGAPASTQMQWAAPYPQQSPEEADPNRWVLGLHSLPSDLNVPAFPDPTLTNAMFSSPNQSGYGMQLPRFIWDQYTKPNAPTNSHYCLEG
jgi:hypothetical protein